MTDRLTQQKGRPALTGLPPKQGLYDPQYEHDACGVGFVVNIKGRKSHQIIQQALQVLVNLDHRGACGCEANTGDGAGILLQTPHEFLMEVCRELGIQLPAPGQYAAGLVFLIVQSVPIAKKISNRSLLKKARNFSDGAPYRPTTVLWAKPPKNPSPASAKSSSSAVRSWPMKWPSSGSYM